MGHPARPISSFALILAAAGLSLSAVADTCVWTGGAGDGRWSSAANWNRPPAAGRLDAVEIDIGSTSQAMTNDLTGLVLTQLRLLGANDACLTLSGDALTLSPSAAQLAFPALTNHCSLVLNAPLRLTATGTLAFYGQTSTVNGALSIDDGVAFRLRCRQLKASAEAGLIGKCTFTVNGRVDGPGAEMHLLLGGNGNGVPTPFNAPVNVGAVYEGESTSQGSAHFKTSGNDIGRVVFSAPAIYADVDNAFTTNTVIELGRHPTTGSTWVWPAGGIVFAPGTEQVANRLDGRPITSRGGQTLRVMDTSEKSGAATLHLHGTANAVTYLALSDILSVSWEPTGDFTQDFRDRVHTSYGGLIVSNGTMRSSGTNCFVRLRTLSIASGAAFEAASANPLGLFPNLSSLTMKTGAVFRVTAEGAACTNILGSYTDAKLENSTAYFELPEGVNLSLNTVIVKKTQVPPGESRTGYANKNPGTAKKVTWIHGAGVITVAAEPKVREEQVIDVPAGEGGLQTALDAVRAIRMGDVDTPLALALAPGDHRLNGNVIDITYDHARNWWAPLTIRAADAANRPRLLGGFAVTNIWQKGLFPGRDDVWSADVTTLTNQFAADVFWFDGKRMSLAQWPNRETNRPYSTGFAYVDATWGSATGVSGWYLDELKIRETDRPPVWSDPAEGFARVYPRHNWSSDIFSVASVSDGLVRLKRAHEAPSENNIWDRYTMYGQRENLDQEGEWYLDRTNRLLHFIPPAGKNPNDGYAALCTDGASITVKKAENVSIERLDFTCMHEALLISSEADEIAVRACRFYELGGFDGRAVNSSGATNVAITDCDFAHLGAGGVRIADSLQTTDGRSNQRVENCYVHHIGETTPGAAGIYTDGQGCAVRHNLVHDVARIGIRGYGRFSEISYNRVRHANLTSDDCACIYGGGWSNGTGVRVLHNWISDCIGYHRYASDDQRSVYYAHRSPIAWGLYVDEAGGGVEVAGNLVTDISRAGALHLHSARWTTVTNNIFALEDCGKCLMSFQSWGSGTLESRTNTVLPAYEKLIAADPRWTDYPSLAQSPRCDETTYCDDGSVMMGTVVERNIFSYPSAASKPAHLCSFFNLVTNRFDRNLYWPGEQDGTTPRDRVYVKSASSPKTNYTFAVWQEDKSEDVHSVVADPQFVTPGGRDGKLQSTSPALALGFAPLDVAEKAGLQITEWRTELPVEEDGVREHPEYLSEMTTWTAGSGDWGAATNWNSGVPTTNVTAVIPANAADQVVAVTAGDVFAPTRLYVGETGDKTTITVTSMVKSAASTFSGEEAVFAGRAVLANPNTSSVLMIYPSVSGTVSRLVFRDQAKLSGKRYDAFVIGNDRDSVAGEAIVDFESDARHAVLGNPVRVGTPNGIGTLNVRKGYVATDTRGLRVGSGNGQRYAICKQSGGNGTLNVFGGALFVTDGVVAEGEVRGLVVGEAASRLSDDLKKSYVPWQGRVNLSGGVITNKATCLVGGARGTGTFVQTGGRYEHPYQKKYRFPFIVGCAGGTGECLFAGGSANIVGDVYVGGVFTNAIPHGSDMKYSLGAYGWPFDDHTAVGKLTFDGGSVSVSGDLNVGFDGTGTLVLGGANAPVTIAGDLVLSNALVRIERRHGAFTPLRVTGKVVNTANARFSVDRDSFAGVEDETLVIRADGGWQGPAPVVEGRKNAILRVGPNGLTMKIRPDPFLIMLR